MTPEAEELVARLKKRAEIRRGIPRSERDRIADQLDEAAVMIEALSKDAERLDYLARTMFEGKWDGTIGRPKAWFMAGPYRHELAKMHGDTFRSAIDAAITRGKEPK
jgi:hypothetical protein